eukprot:1157419-Pelagomonas_calceolata.AAC.6
MPPGPARFSSQTDAQKQGGLARPDRPPPCLLFVLADARGCQQQLDEADCNAGRQRGAAGLHKSRPLSSALLLADFGAPPKTVPRQLAAGDHLGTQGISWLVEHTNMQAYRAEGFTKRHQLSAEKLPL